MGIISSKLRQSARGRECTFRIPGICNGDPETTVLCHAPSGTGGMGTKGHDFLAAFGCSACHEALDRKQIIPDFNSSYYWLQGIMETWTVWALEGLIEVPSFNASEPEKVKRKPGRKANLPKRKIPNGRKLQSRPFPKRDPLLTAQMESDATGSSTDGRYDA